jgi:hypothetical protein
MARFRTSRSRLDSNEEPIDDEKNAIFYISLSAIALAFYIGLAIVGVYIFEFKYKENKMQVFIGLLVFLGLVAGLVFSVLNYIEKTSD